MPAIIATGNQDLAERRTRLAHALKTSFEAAADHTPAARLGELEQHLRAVEHEGRTRGFLPMDGARG